MPLSLTLLSAAFPADRRGLAIGIWSGLSGLAVALGPVVGGAVVDGLSWQWIFFLNVPIGIVLAPFAYRVLDESHGPDGVLDVRGLVLASTGLFALVWGIVRGNDQGWLSPEILGVLALAVAMLGAFVAWERRAPAPMLPLRLFRSRAFSATNGVSLIMNFGIFGSIFLLAQFLQTVQGYSAFDAGVRTLPWTLMPMFIAPLAGLYSDRIGSRPLMFTGLALQATALGVARERGLADGRLQQPDHPLRARRHRHGPRLRTGLEHDPLERARAATRARPAAPTTPFARSAARSAWPCSPACSVASGLDAHRPGVRRRPRACGLDRSRRARRRGVARPGRAGPARRAARRHGGRFARRPRARAGAGSQRIVSTNGALAFPARPGTRARSANWPACTMANEVAKLPGGVDANPADEAPAGRPRAPRGRGRVRATRPGDR